ncbi:MAG: CHC2 zinc finger domain-containing protein [Candidatus Methanoperedens sp.]
MWHCFGCGKGGDVIALVMAMEGLDFLGAVRRLSG